MAAYGEPAGAWAIGDTPCSAKELVQTYGSDEGRHGDVESGGAVAPPAQPPFLLRFPIAMFGAPLALAAQSSMFLNLTKWQHRSNFLRAAVDYLNYIYFFAAGLLLLAAAAVYGAKIACHEHAVRVEWTHSVRNNMFFLPVIASILLIMATPEHLRSDAGSKIAYWVCFTIYALIAVPLFENWFRKPYRSMRHANPTYQIAIVSNFVLAIVGYQLGYRDVPTASFAVGLVFQVTVFINSFQAGPKGAPPASAGSPSGTPPASEAGEETSDDKGPVLRMLCFVPPCCSGNRAASSWQLPPDLHPTMFLYMAPPSLAALAAGALFTFDNIFSIGAFYFALTWFFMQVSAYRLFIYLRFTPSWFAYCFPMSACANASIAYARVRPDDVFPDIICGTLCTLAFLVTLVVFIRALVAAVRGSFFVRDVLVSGPAPLTQPALPA